MFPKLQKGLGWVVGGTALLWIGLFVVRGFGECTVSESIGEHSGLLYGSFIVTSAHLVLTAFGWYFLYAEKFALRTGFIIFLEGVQDGVLGAALTSYGDTEHFALAVALVSVWYFKLLFFPYTRWTFAAQLVLAAVSLSFLATFAFGNGNFHYEYAGLFLLFLTNLPPAIVQKQQQGAGYFLVQ